MRVSFAIATWNRCALLGQTLDALAGLTVPPGVEVEVWVCDNNSTDATKAAVDQRRTAFPFPLTYLFEPRQGKSFALNRMIEQATGDWIYFLDDDVLVDPGSLAALVRGIGKYPKAACFGGPIVPWLDQPVRGRRALLLGQYPAIFGLMAVERDTPMSPPDRSAWGANLALRRAAIPAGGFATALGMIGRQRIAGEDVGMVRAIVAAGHEAWLLPDVVVRHWTPGSSIGLRRFWRWQMGFGRAWALERGRPREGRLGVPWWAWGEFLRRAARAAAHWRPYANPAYYEAVGAAAQYYGYLRSGTSCGQTSGPPPTNS